MPAIRVENPVTVKVRRFESREELEGFVRLLASCEAALPEFLDSRRFVGKTGSVAKRRFGRFWGESAWEVGIELGGCQEYGPMLHGWSLVCPNCP